MSQANTMNPKRMNPTTPKRWRGKGGLVESRSIIKPKPSKHNFMEMPDVVAPRSRMNKRKQEQAKRGGVTIRAKMIGFAAAMFGMGQSLR